LDILVHGIQRLVLRGHHTSPLHEEVYSETSKEQNDHSKGQEERVIWQLGTGWFEVREEAA
jgi:hypothetical protein